MKKIILTGGGTAGHIYPVIVIAKSLQRNKRVKIIYAGLKSGIERDIAKKSEIPYFSLVTGKRRAYFSIKNFIDLFKTIIGLTQAFFLFCFFKPDLVFAKGGYVSFPIVFWAKHFKTPLVIHESDIIMGKTNLWAAKFARRICLGFSVKNFQKYNKLNINLNKFVYTGIPLRNEFYDAKIKQDKTKPKILFTGGSQGANKINNIIQEILPDLLKKYEIYHIAGNKDYNIIKENKGIPDGYHLYNYTDNIATLMAESELIISRAGANTLAEISALSKPSILIPLPSAANDHQSINAKLYQEENAAVVVSEKNLTASSLLSIINRLMEDEKLRNLMGHHAKEFIVLDSTSIITDLLYEVKNDR